MARDWVINGETLVKVKGRTDSSIGSLSELGLAVDQITLTFNFRHSDIQLDAWGGPMGPPAEVQVMLADIIVSMNLIHTDRAVLEECGRLSMGGPTTWGQLARAGARMGNNVARFAAGNNFVGLNLTSPVQGLPWRFYHSYLTNPPISWPLGVEKEVIALNWRVIPYTTDPYQGGLGASGYQLFDHQNDT